MAPYALCVGKIASSSLNVDQCNFVFHHLRSCDDLLIDFEHGRVVGHTWCNTAESNRLVAIFTPYLVSSSAILDHLVQGRLDRLFPNRQDRQRSSCWHHHCAKHGCCFAVFVEYQVRVFAHIHDLDFVIILVIKRNEDLVFVSSTLSRVVRCGGSQNLAFVQLSSNSYQSYLIALPYHCGIGHSLRSVGVNRSYSSHTRIIFTCVSCGIPILRTSSRSVMLAFSLTA